MKKLYAVLVVTIIVLAASVVSCLFFYSETEIDAEQPSLSIVVQNAWARQLPPVAKNGAAYLTLYNNGLTDERLVSMSSSISEMAMLHQNLVDEGMNSMIHVDELLIKAGQTDTFKPGAYHIMLMGLNETLHQGQSFVVTLNFEHAPSIKVIVNII